MWWWSLDTHRHNNHCGRKQKDEEAIMIAVLLLQGPLLRYFDFPKTKKQTNIPNLDRTHACAETMGMNQSRLQHPELPMSSGNNVTIRSNSSSYEQKLLPTSTDQRLSRFCSSFRVVTCCLKTADRSDHGKSTGNITFMFGGQVQLPIEIMDVILSFLVIDELHSIRRVNLQLHTCVEQRMEQWIRSREMKLDGEKNHRELLLFRWARVSFVVRLGSKQVLLWAVGASLLHGRWDGSIETE